MQNAEWGVRNGRVSELARDLSLLLRIPHSAFRILFLVAACTPITTRPDFRPDPRALSIILDARPERVTAMLDSVVAAESLEVAHANVRDGYVETAWYDPQAHRTRHHERDLEVIASKEHEGYKIAQRLVDKLKQKFGVPKAAQEQGRPTPPPSPSPTPP